MHSLAHIGSAVFHKVGLHIVLVELDIRIPLLAHAVANITLDDILGTSAFKMGACLRCSFFQLLGGTLELANLVRSCETFGI